MPIAAVDRIFRLIRLRQTLERVRRPNNAIFVAQDLQHRAHENHGTTAPYACLEQVSGYTLIDHRSYAAFEVIQAAQADHGLGALRPVTPPSARVALVRAAAHQLKALRPERLADNASDAMPRRQRSIPADDMVVVLEQRSCEASLQEVGV